MRGRNRARAKASIRQGAVRARPNSGETRRNYVIERACGILIATLCKATAFIVVYGGLKNRRETGRQGQRNAVWVKVIH